MSRLLAENTRHTAQVTCFVYIIRCADGTLYTGMTNSVMRRFAQHKSGQGAVWTQNHGVVDLLYVERCKDRPSAARRERAIKGMSRQAKFELIASPRNLATTSVN